MRFKGNLALRVTAWSALLVVVLLWRFWPREETGPLETSVQVPLRHATPEEWSSSLAELGARHLARRITVRGVSEVARGLLVRYDRGAGPEVAYLRHPEEPNAAEVAVRLMSALRTTVPADGGGASAKVWLYFFAGEEPVTPAELEQYPLYFSLPPGWTALSPP